MKIVVHHEGASTLAGRIQAFAKERVLIGRSPEADVVFDPDRDRYVSSTHLELSLSGKTVTAKDLGSRNGTYLNGHKFEGERPVGPDDELRLGPRGPRLRITLDDGSGGGHRAPGSAAAKKGIGEATLMRVVTKHVGRERKRLVFLGIFGFLLLLGGIGYFAWKQKQQEQNNPQTAEAQEEQMRRIAKELQDASTAEERERLEGELEKIRNSVRNEFTDVANKLREAESKERREELQKRLDELEKSILDATPATGDWTALTKRYRPSIFLCLARNRTKGTAGTGTAFAVRRGGILATNAHVGKMLRESPEKSVVQDGTGREFKILEIHNHPGWTGRPNSTDLAILKIDLRGVNVEPIPIADDNGIRRLGSGTTIGTLGYPGELAQEYLRQTRTGAFTKVLATFKVGMVSALANYNREKAPFEQSVYVQHSASLTGGTSGSPMFTQDGKVVAVNNASFDLFLGDDGSLRTPSAVQIKFAIRADLLSAFLKAKGY